MLLFPVTRPGSLKRGMNVSMLEESMVKRSRTSSISSVSRCPVTCGIPGTARNPIRSSYSSSQGYPQVAYLTMYSDNLSLIISVLLFYPFYFSVYHEKCLIPRHNAFILVFRQDSRNVMLFILFYH